MWITYSYFFVQQNVQQNLKSILARNTETLILHLKLKKNVSPSFLDIKISRENNKFVTSVQRKPTSCGVFTNFESFISKSYKCSLIDTYAKQSLFPSMEKFYQEINTLNSEVSFQKQRASSTYASKTFQINYLSKIK